ncbi:MAG: hypothetical protein P4L99_10885 [Chthoniobacter sp.]|nr:hypothetical protein [Chthoniobacter sp.]
MKRFTFLFAVATLGLSLAALAADSDPGFGNGHRWYGGRDFDLPTVGNSGLQPLYYRPTMRYYGNGYTVNYRYIPVYPQDSIYLGATAGSSNFRTEAFHMSTDEIPSWGANSPRLTVKDPHSAAPRTAVTSIVRKKTSKSSTKTAPEVAPTDAPAITPAPDAVPAQPKP